MPVIKTTGSGFRHGCPQDMVLLDCLRTSVSIEELMSMVMGRR